MHLKKNYRLENEEEIETAAIWLNNVIMNVFQYFLSFLVFSPAIEFNILVLWKN